MKNTQALGLCMTLSVILKDAEIIRIGNAINSTSIYHFNCKSKYSPLSKTVNMSNIENNYDQLLDSCIQLGYEQQIEGQKISIKTDNDRYIKITQILNSKKEEAYQDFLSYAFQKTTKSVFASIQNLKNLQNSIGTLFNIFYNNYKISISEQECLDYALTIFETYFGTESLNQTKLGQMIDHTSLARLIAEIEMSQEYLKNNYNPDENLNDDPYTNQM